MADPSPDLAQSKQTIVSSSIVVPASAEATSQRKRESEDQSEINGKNNEEGVRKLEWWKDLSLKTNPGANYVQKPQKRPRLEMSQDGQRRGKRMFGVLMGTLNKFKTDTSTKSSAEKQRQEIDNKLKEKLERERRELAESIAKDKEDHLERQQEKKRRSKEEIAQKLALADAKHRVLLSRYIKTAIDPQLLYRPAKLSEAQKAQIQSQEASAKSELKKMIESQEKAVAEGQVDKEEKSKSNEIENENVKMDVIEESQQKALSGEAPDAKRDTAVETPAIDNGDDATDQRGDASSQNGDIVDYEGEP